MSAIDIIGRALREAKVAPVASGSTADATPFSEQKQSGSKGSTGSTEKSGSEARSGRIVLNVTVDTDGVPKRMTVLAAPGETAQQAVESLHLRFGARLIEVKEVAR
ncbi:MAG: hypothetical protein GVY22_16990 [Gammaproteobacteria bacterium]|nr:hypothetical protein [Gammaproteobacteria bacterium]